MLKNIIHGMCVKILFSTLDNVQYSKEMIKMYRIMKYKAILLQNLLVNYANHY